METTKDSTNWEESDKRIIRFREPFSEKYNLTITTDMLAGNFPIRTKAQVRWALRVINVTRSGESEIELITIENKLVETNNPNLQDIAAFSQAFSRMYSEVHVKLDAKGKILEIINLPVILNKWEETKAEMQKLLQDVPAMQDVINLNDEIFASPDKVKLAIENNEFFSIYFNLIYGTPLPVEDLKKTHRNMFNSVDVDWNYSAKSVHGRAGKEIVTDVFVTGTPGNDLGKDWAKEAYAAFGHLLDLSKLDPQLAEKVNYRFQSKTGKLMEAVWIKEETAHPQYIRSKMTYKLKSDTGSEKTVDSKSDGEIDKEEYPRQPVWSGDSWIE